MFSVLALPLKKTGGDDKNLTIIAGLHAQKNRKLFPVISGSWKSENSFFEERTFHRLNQQIMLIQINNIFSFYPDTSNDDKHLKTEAHCSK